ncbi:MAG: carboxy terminal-processing peptidase [Bacteroidia bacterium]|jgi:carboxyl-terminal processing protease|nr:carboxy terminal-processing peptidase [Bacteroidia bacterium]
MHKLYLSTAIAIVSFTTACASDTTQVKLKPLQPEEHHQIAFQTSLQFVASYHYAKPTINDSFSTRAFDEYIQNLDPSRVYFLDSDLRNFEQYRYQIDDYVFNGNVEPAFTIFNTYQQRLNDRIQYSLAYLNKGIAFNRTDSFQVDRERAQWCRNVNELNALWEQKLTYECLLLKVNGKDTNSTETIKKRYLNLLKFAGKTKSEDVFQLYMNAILETTDPHTNYFSPRTAEDFNQSMSLSLEGIGAQLQTENEYTKIREIIKGGPADKSKKLFAGDKIIGVAQGKDSDVVNVVDWRIDDVVSLIRGKKGTSVRLQIIPASEPNTTKYIDLVRDKIMLEDQSAKSAVKTIDVDGKKVTLGVITLPTFYIDFAAQQRGDRNYKSTTRDVKKLIEELKSSKVDGIVIDLRNNGGGSLQEAIELTGLFMSTGPVVQVRNADGTVSVKNDYDKDIFYNGPLTVLVNRFSASASEIFAAAIQDYGRGVVLGERTFGKGTVQNMVDLNEFIQYNGKKLGQVKLTIAKFYRITGGSTQHKGVTPDIEFPSIYAADKFGEDASKYALPWDSIPSATYATSLNVSSNLLNQLKVKHKQRMQASAEYGYLLEDIALFEKADNEQYVTLNEGKLQTETNQEADAKKAREQQRKKNNKEGVDLILEESAWVIRQLN